MLRKALVMRLFDGFFIQRWNDQVRPIELVEMDKHAHKMAIAYCLARYEEAEGQAVDWHNLVRGGLFELLRRIVVADIKSPIYRKIRKQRPEVLRRLNGWVFDQLKPVLPDGALRAEFEAYLGDEGFLDPLSRRLLDAAHVYASFWEFQLLKPSNPLTWQMQELEPLMYLDLEPHLGLAGMRRLVCRDKVSRFVDLVGQLRFQVRWSQTARIPRTSVLGHSMMVATLAYLLSRQVGACDARLRNNFFGGLFHDLPESLTRDIISPVKGADASLQEVIGEIERELVAEQIHPLLADIGAEPFRYLTENEFTSKVRDGGVQAVSSDRINQSFNEDRFDAYDGEIVKVSDHLAAFVEAYVSKETGISTKHLEDGLNNLRRMYQNSRVAGIDVSAIYADF